MNDEELTVLDEVAALLSKESGLAPIVGFALASLLDKAELLRADPDPEDVEVNISWSVVHNGTGNPAISQTDCYDEASARKIATRYPGRTLYRVTTTTTETEQEMPL